MATKTKQTKCCEKTIKNWPEDDRPREKLLKKGAKTLSNSELLAILLRTGINGSSAVDIARQIMKKFGSFRNMAHTDICEWKEFKGLGLAKMAHIQAALEIGRRFREVETSHSRQKITSANDLVEILMPQMRDLKTELFKVVYLDSNSKIIEICDVALGTVNKTIPIVREIIHSALQKFTTSLICVHNHPSGEAIPSRDDIAFTKELYQAGDLMKIEVLDHIIIGNNTFYSFADENKLYS